MHWQLFLISSLLSPPSSPSPSLQGSTTKILFSPQMPTSHTHLESPNSMHLNGSPDSPSSPRPQSSWKSVFRFPNSSSKKLPSNGSPLLHETQPLPVSSHRSVSHTLVTPTASLTPITYLSDQRSSYNSSNTQSSDTNGGLTSRSPYMTPQSRPYPRYSQPKSTEALSAATPPRSRQHTKSERARPNNPRLQPPPRSLPLTVDPSQSPFSPNPPTPSRSRTNGPLSPKSVSASASRFIRRVASAPNAKGLFSMGSRSSSAITKNGLLAPANTVLPLPQLVSSSSDQGQDSLETVSSGSSRGRISRLNPPMTAPVSGPRGVSQHGLQPGKAAFRRTYSSNSIKVRQVR